MNKVKRSLFQGSHTVLGHFDMLERLCLIFLQNCHYFRVHHLVPLLPIASCYFLVDMPHFISHCNFMNQSEIGK